MDEVLTIKLNGLAAREISRIRVAVGISLRDAEIRHRFAEIKPGIGREGAISRLADEYHLSYRQIWRIVYGG